MGHRDYAVLMILAKLGLRASEVATLNLHDIPGSRARSSCTVRGGGRRLCRYVTTSEQLSWLISGMGGPLQRVGEFSCEHLPHTSALPPAAPSR
jgi:integrase